MQFDEPTISRISRILRYPLQGSMANSDSYANSATTIAEARRPDAGIGCTGRAPSTAAVRSGHERHPRVREIR